jgi:hypothetical protein
MSRGSPARQNKQKCYASLRLAARFRVGSLSNRRDIRLQHIRNVPYPAGALAACNGSKAAKSRPAKNIVSRKTKIVRATAAVRRKSQSVETVSLEPKSPGTRAGVGAGDFQGISILENVDSESAEELLEEGGVRGWDHQRCGRCSGCGQVRSDHARGSARRCSRRV